MPVIYSPGGIEARSFEIVDGFLDKFKLSGQKREIIQRVIHATARVDYARDIIFHPRAIRLGLRAIKSGRYIVADVNMIKAGINQKILGRFGGRVICAIGDRDTIKSASVYGITKAAMGMRKSVKLLDKAIVAIGNAPTALFEVCDLIEKRKITPALVIGVPVGFVGAKEAKKRLAALDTPYITNLTRYGGSSVACAIVNALLKIAERTRPTSFK